MLSGSGRRLPSKAPDRSVFGHAGVLDTEAIEPAGPRVEISPAGDRERHVVQARPPLIEGLTGVAVVVMQPSTMPVRGSIRTTA